MQWKKRERYEHKVGHLVKNEMDWAEVTDFVKILDRFNEPFFIEVHGLMDKTWSRSNIETESVRITSCYRVQRRENPFSSGFQYSTGSWK